MSRSRRRAYLLAGLAASGLLLAGCQGSAVPLSKAVRPKVVCTPGSGGEVKVQPAAWMYSAVRVAFQDKGVATTYQLCEGQALYFVPNNPATVEDWTVTADPAGSVQPYRGALRGGAYLNPRIEGLKGGTATVTITSGKQRASFTCTVTVLGLTWKQLSTPSS